MNKWQRGMMTTMVTCTTAQSINHILTQSAFPQDSPVCASCVVSQSYWSPSAGCSSLVAGSTWVDSSCRSNWPGPSPSTRARWGRALSQQLQCVAFSSHKDTEMSTQHYDDSTLSFNKSVLCWSLFIIKWMSHLINSCFHLLVQKLIGATFSITSRWLKMTGSVLDAQSPSSKFKFNRRGKKMVMNTDCSDESSPL